jgi:O-antigen ligase
MDFSQSSWLVLAALAFVGAVLLAAAANWIRRENLCLFFWAVLLAHRNVLPRQLAAITELSPSSSLLTIEAGVTTVVFAVTLALLISGPAARRKRLPRTLRLLCFYAAAVTVTCLWSHNRLYSAFWAMRLWCVALLPALYFQSSDSPTKPQTFMWATVVGLIPTFALQWIGLLTSGFSADGRVYAFWIGAVWPSIVAFSLASGYVIKLVQSPKPATACLALLFIANGVIGGSKTGGAACLASVGILALSNSKRFLRPSVLASACGLVAVLIVAVPRDVGLVGHLTYQHGSLDTVNDRVDLWKTAVIPRILQSPVVGSGFATSSVERLTSEYGWEAGHAHNGVLNSLVEVGIVGSLPLFLAILSILGRICWRARWMTTDPVTSWMVAAWICLLISGSVELTFGGSLQPPVYLFYALTISIDAASRTRQGSAPHVGSARAGLGLIHRPARPVAVVA